MPVPDLLPGHVLVRHDAIGVNYVDTQHRAGEPYPVDLPLIPGIEASGRVVDAAPGVDTFVAGDRVAYAGPMVGVYAEIASVPAAEVVRVPDDVAADEAAAVLLQGMTAHVMTHDVYNSTDDTVALVHAAAGGTGSLLVQFLLAQGATVIASTSSEAKSTYLRALGVQHVINYRESDVVESVHALSPAGVDVVFDSVGRATFESSLRAVRPMGTIVAFGQSSGPVAAMDVARLSGLTGENLPGSLWLTWPTLTDYNRTREALAARAEAVFGAVVERRLSPSIAGRIPLDEASRAHELLETGSVIGKLLLAL